MPVLLSTVRLESSLMNDPIKFSNEAEKAFGKLIRVFHQILGRRFSEI